MITIKYYNSIRAFGMDAEGHAGYAEKGKDIVCAGISALLNTLLIAVLKAKRKNYIRNLDYLQEDGKMHLEFRYSQLNFLFEAVEVILEGLYNIERIYPKYVRIIKIKEKPKNPRRS